MRIHRVQKGISLKASGASGGVELCLAAVAIDDVVTDIAGIGRIGDAKLRVIEDVEGLGTKLDIEMVGICLEVLEQRHIEVDPPGIPEVVTARVAKGQAAGSGKSSGVEQQRPDVVSARCDERLAAVR